LDGKARAMVVTSSRVEAVRWQLAINKYIQENGYPLRTLVAFSGEVNDKESGPDPFKETSSVLNPDLKGRNIAEAFKDDLFQILLVANKFQTGFDQPLLCGMYVDKRLAGIQAVQTLSRLNRCYPGKDNTYVLDFVNEPSEVLDAFKTYFTTAELSDVTDREIILTLRTKLDALGYYDEHEIDRVVNVVLDPNSKQKQLEAAITPVADRLLKKFAAAKEAHTAAVASKDDKAAQAAKDTMDALVLFSSDVSTYLRAYTFLSQIFDYGNTDFEKRAIFFKYLVKLLKFGREREGVDLSDVTLTHHKLSHRGERNLGLSDKDSPKLNPLTEIGSGTVREKQKAYLTEIISKLNEIYGTDTTDGDQLSHATTLNEKVLESTVLQKQATSNSKEQFANSPDLTSEIMNAIIDAMDVQADLSTKALNSPEMREGLKRIMLNQLGLYEKLRDRAAGA
jgi:type I restriction enzyme R subunit